MSRSVSHSRPSPSPRLWVWLLVLAAIHLAALFAGRLAPFDPAEQHRDRPQAPPARWHLVDAEGRLHAWPFAYPLVEDPARPGAYAEDRSQPCALGFAVGSSVGSSAGEPPCQIFLLGTDRYGRDLFSRLLHGAHPSLFAGLLAAALAVGLGLGLGTVAGFYGGVVDALTMRATELLLALPWLYLLLAARAFLPLDLPPTTTFFATVALLGTVGWSGPARLVRGLAASVRERPFVVAARGFGASQGYLLWRHVLPAALPLTLTQVALLVPRYVIAEVTLSFLGLGVAEPAASWGGALAELREIHTLLDRPWTLAPAFALAVVVLSYHRLENALRMRWGGGID